MHDTLIIIGAGGHGKVIADIAMQMNQYSSICFLDDSKELDSCLGLPVVGSSKDDFSYVHKADLFVAIGNADKRKSIMERLLSKGARFPVLIHPKAIISQDVTIGEGTVVMPGTVINPGTRIGKGCIVNTSSSVDHDCNVGDYVHIAVGAHVAGTVKIGAGTWIGAGATISNNVNICSDCLIGAGAVVVKDITESGTYIGIPAVKRV